MATQQRKTDKAEGFAAFFKTPNFDMNSVMEAQRKNLEAMMEANRVAFEGYKDAAEKQLEIVRKSMDEASGAANEALSGKTPEANATKQVELAQGVARSSFEGFREVAELTLKANREAFAVIQKRFNEGVDEIKAQQAS